MPAVGSSRQSTRAPDAMRHASSTTRRVPVDSSLTKRSTNAAESEERDDLVRLGARRALPRSDAGHREPDRLPHRQVLEQLRALERPAEPESRPRPGRAGARRGRGSRRARCCGTNPPIAFISVDLPAPFAPMSPTTSPGPTCEIHVVDARGAARTRPRARGSDHRVETGRIARGSDAGRVGQRLARRRPVRATAGARRASHANSASRAL